VLSAATGAVAQYSIDSSTGQLSYVSVITIPNGGVNAMIPELIAIDASGTHAYVSAQYNNVQNTTNGEVMDYSIDQTSGNLTLVNTVAAGVYARSVLIDPTGTHVYVANVFGDSISEYSVDPVNGLQLLTTISTGAGSNPSALNLDPTGQYVYASLGGTNSIIEYSFNPDGTLNFLSSVATGSGPDWVSSGN
jgi:6-phosphogluconolactonase (cycloisomerase 2 family)